MNGHTKNGVTYYETYTKFMQRSFGYGIEVINSDARIPTKICGRFRSEEVAYKAMCYMTAEKAFDQARENSFNDTDGKYIIKFYPCEMEITPYYLDEKCEGYGVVAHQHMEGEARFYLAVPEFGQDYRTLRIKTDNGVIKASCVRGECPKRSPGILLEYIPDADSASISPRVLMYKPNDENAAILQMEASQKPIKSSKSFTYKVNGENLGYGIKLPFSENAASVLYGRFSYDEEAYEIMCYFATKHAFNNGFKKKHKCIVSFNAYEKEIVMHYENNDTPVVFKVIPYEEGDVEAEIDFSDDLNFDRCSIDTVTVNGVIKATPSMNQNRPGIDVEYLPSYDIKHVKMQPRILMEKPEGGKIRVLVWNDVKTDEHPRIIEF